MTPRRKRTIALLAIALTAVGTLAYFALRDRSPVASISLRAVRVHELSGPRAQAFGKYQVEVSLNYEGPPPGVQYSFVRDWLSRAGWDVGVAEQVSWKPQPSRLIDAAGNDLTGVVIKPGWMANPAQKEVVFLYHFTPPADAAVPLRFEGGVGVHDGAPVAVSVEIPASRQPTTTPAR